MWDKLVWENVHSGGSVPVMSTCMGTAVLGTNDIPCNTRLNLSFWREISGRLEKSKNRCMRTEYHRRKWRHHKAIPETQILLAVITGLLPSRDTRRKACLRAGTMTAAEKVPVLRVTWLRSRKCCHNTYSNFPHTLAPQITDYNTRHWKFNARNKANLNGLFSDALKRPFRRINMSHQHGTLKYKL
jgi:hypothetical protein